jgi:hypothetical protein
VEDATVYQGIAQSGRVLAWGARGRRFESDYPDHVVPTVCGMLVDTALVGKSARGHPASTGRRMTPRVRGPSQTTLRRGDNQFRHFNCVVPVGPAVGSLALARGTAGWVLLSMISGRSEGLSLGFEPPTYRDQV